MLVGDPNYNLDMQEKLQKPVCRTVDRTVAAPIKPLNHHRNVASLSLYFGRYSSKPTGLVLLPCSCGRSTHSNRLDDFSVTISRCY